MRPTSINNLIAFIFLFIAIILAIESVTLADIFFGIAFGMFLANLIILLNYKKI